MFTSETTEWQRKGGLAKAAKYDKQWNDLVMYLAGDCGASVKEKIAALSNGEELSEPEHQFLSYWLQLLEYHKPKLARNEGGNNNVLVINMPGGQTENIVNRRDTLAVPERPVDASLSLPSGLQNREAPRADSHETRTNRKRRNKKIADNNAPETR